MAFTMKVYESMLSLAMVSLAGQETNRRDCSTSSATLWRMCAPSRARISLAVLLLMLLLLQLPVDVEGAGPTSLPASMIALDVIRR